jgi:hypothetical protein
MAQYSTRITTDVTARFEQCQEQALRVLTAAADSWAQGSPADPDPAAVLEQIIDLFARQKFLRRPFGGGF